MGVSVFASGAMPARCPNGHPWGPGTVTIGWRPCSCPRAIHGHHWVRCEAEGCRKIWLDPPHQAA